MLDSEVLCAFFGVSLLLSTHRLEELKVQHLLPRDLGEASISPFDESCLDVGFVEFDKLVLDLGTHVYLKIPVQSSPVVEVAIESLAQHFTYQVTRVHLARSQHG